MISRIGTIALLALLGTLLVFFFPAACGPFTATYGPATAFRAAAAVQALLILLCSLVAHRPAAATFLFRDCDPFPPVRRSCISRPSAFVANPFPWQSPPILNGAGNPK